MEGVIKLKRLGEDELLRIYESRHWLYNLNLVQSASKDRLGREEKEDLLNWGESLCWAEMNQAIGYLHALLVRMTIGVKFLFKHCFSRSMRTALSK